MHTRTQTTTAAEKPLFEINKELKARDLGRLEWLQLKSTFKDIPANRPECLLQVWDFAKARNLDVMVGHIHAYVNDNHELQITCTISGYRAIAHASGEFAGMDAPQLGPLTEVDIGGMTVTAPSFISVTVYRAVGDNRYPVTATEYLIENIPNGLFGGSVEFWQTRPIGQLTIRAEAQAHRKAFSGCDAYTPEEFTYAKNALQKNQKIEEENTIVTILIGKYDQAKTPEEITMISKEAEAQFSKINHDERQAILSSYEEACFRVRG